MRLGILDAIPARESRIDWGGTPVEGYIRFFQQSGASFSYTGYHVAGGDFPASPDECDAYLITGSPKGVYDEETWIPRLAAFVRQAHRRKKKLVGICFGHQMLAHALGGRAQKSEKGLGIGLRSFEISNNKPWMNGSPDSCSLYFAHQDQVVQLPAGAELLGGDAFCPNTAFAIDGLALGIQGHPEFTPEMMRSLFAGMDGATDPQVLETAVRSLEQGEPDNRLVAGWIINFLNG